MPTTAIAHEDGREFCYVAHDDGLERREVKLGGGTPDFLEISEGLRKASRSCSTRYPGRCQDITDETLLISEAKLADGETVEELAEVPAREVNPKSRLRQADALQ